MLHLSMERRQLVVWSNYQVFRSILDPKTSTKHLSRCHLHLMELGFVVGNRPGRKDMAVGVLFWLSASESDDSDFDDDIAASKAENNYDKTNKQHRS